MRNIRIAVVGVGWMGINHARVLSELDSVELVAVCDKDEEQAKKIASRYNVNCYTNYDDLFEKENIDAITIATPAETHKEIALEAIKKKLHILLEKPIATNVKDAEEIEKRANDEGIKLMVGHTERFNPAIQKLKELLNQNKIGKIYKIDVRRVGPFPKRISDVGIVTDLAVHDIDVVNFLFNPKITNIYAETMKMIHPKHEDLLTAVVRFDSGIHAIFNVNWLTPAKQREISVMGEKGMLFVNYLTQDLFFHENKHFSYDNLYNNTSGMSEGDVVKIHVDKKEPLRSEIESFVDYILNNTSPPVFIKDSIEALSFAQKILEISKSTNHKHI